MTEPTPTLADIYATCETLRAQQEQLAERFAAWDYQSAARAILHAAPEPHGPAEPPQRPQERPEHPPATPATPDPLRSAQAGVQGREGGPEPAAPAPDGLRERLRQRITSRVATAVINQDRPFIELLLDAALAEVQPQLDQLAEYDNRISWETNCGEHARLLDACYAADCRAERAEAAVQRVRAIHTHGPRTNTCNEDGAMWPCDTIRALDGTDTPKET